MMTVLSIAGGGALGALLRHFMNTAVADITGPSFPWGIFAVNVLGSFALGLLAALFAHAWDAPQGVKIFLTTGFLGGFTTFSAFSLDTVLLFERGEGGAALFYMCASVLCSVAALYGGMTLVRAFAS